jgi:LPS sulfotransferase NodH
MPTEVTYRRPWIESSKFNLEWERLKVHLRMQRKWWLRRHKPFQPLFVIATCRSGSNLLLSYLNQQPGVRALSEVLCPLMPMGPRHDRLPPAKAIQHIRYCLQGEKTPVRGCKLMLYQLAFCELGMNQLHAAFPDAKYIVLYRESLAEQYVSHQLAISTRQFLLRPGEQRKQAELTIKPTELRTYCDDIRRGYCEVLHHRWLEGRSVLLSYEELIDDPQHWLRDEICPLLGVQYAAPQTQLCKQNTRPLAQQVTNYRDVAALLQSPLCRQHHSWPWQRAGRKHAA